MNELRQLIEQSETAIARYNRHIPAARGAWLAQLVFHRDWELRIVADYRRHLARA